MKEVAALHKHWCTADAVKLSLATPVHDGLPDWPEDVLALAKFHSQFLRLSVWYALLFVVIEGYRDLKVQDPTIDQLLAQDAFTNSLRLFRNAVFHFQEDPAGPKLMTFLETPGSEKWVHQLHSSFKGFFEKSLPLKEIMQSMGVSGGA